MDNNEITKLQKLAFGVRKSIIESIYNAKSGHPGGSLSIADMLVYLYEKEMNIYPDQPCNQNRDLLVLSKGHTAPALYAVLAHKGYFAKEELLRLRKVGAMLQGHPDMKGTPGVDMSTGSLGQGISAAVGMALAAKLNGTKQRVFAILGDGELQEGQVWEAAMFAGNHGLNNLVAVVDNNNLQIDGTVEEVNSPYPITEKFKAFKWCVVEADAHDFNSIEAAFTKVSEERERPCVVVQKSIKGKGISFMENNASWHGSAPNEEQYIAACDELAFALSKLEGKA